MEYYSAIKRNTFDSVLMSWMNLEPAVQTEVSQKEKNKCRILMHMYGIQKDGADEPIYRAAMEAQTENRGCGGGRRGWDEWREQHGSIDTTMCKIHK